jgi:hypothetical protein
MSKCGRNFGKSDSRDVVATLERLRFERSVPQRIYCDNGTEFVIAAMDLWANTNGVILDFSRRGKRPITPRSNRSTVGSAKSV